MSRQVIAILGCTASGKAEAARALAGELDAELLSIDSMKVYRGMDIGTAKPTAEHRTAQPWHMLDLVDPWESFSAAEFVERADACVAEIHGRGRPVIAVGGTVLYFQCFYLGMFEGPAADAGIRGEIRARAANEGLAALHAELARVDAAAAERIHVNDLRRIERALEVHRLTGRPITELQQQWATGKPRRADWDWRLVGLRRAREAGNHRINDRVRRMAAAGLVDEARGVWGDARGVSQQAAQAVGYAELFAHFRGELSLDEAVEKIKINSRRLAKQQRTWLRRLPGLQWIELAGDEPATDRIAEIRALLNS